MPVARYVTLKPVEHNQTPFAVGTPMALSDEYAAPLVAAGAIQAQAGALPEMPDVPGDVIREAKSGDSGAVSRWPLEVIAPNSGIRVPLPTFREFDARAVLAAQGILGSKNTQTVVDPFGAVIDPSGSTNNSTFGMCINIPCVFDAIQIGYTHRGGSGACTGITALIAVTDDYGDKSLANTTEGKKFITPRKAGVEYNLVDNNGWKAVTWSGSASGSAPDLGANNYNTVMGDIIPIKGIEDASNPGWAPLLIRMYPGAGVFSRASYSGISDPAKYVSEAGPAVILGAVRSGENISTPTTWGLANGPSFGDTAYLPVVIVAYSQGKAVSVMLCGDSRFDAASETAATYGYAGFAWQLQKGLIARGVRAAISRSCVAGMSSASYQQQGLDMFAEGLRPNVALYTVYTVNDGAPTQAVCSVALQRAMQFGKECVAGGVEPILVTAYPKGSGFGANLPNLRALVAAVKSLGYRWISPIDDYGDTNGTWAGGRGFDDDHGKQSFYVEMAAQVSDMIYLGKPPV